jgi:RES domain
MLLPPHFIEFSGCASLATRPETNTWYRAIQLRHLPTPLKTGHTRWIPSRFNAATQPPAHQFRVLYLAETSQVALFEVRALLGSPFGYPGVISVPTRSWTSLNVSVNLRRVADLTVSVETDKLQTTIQELTGDWRGYRQRGLLGTVPAAAGVVAPTQELGARLQNVSLPDGTPRFEGFITASAALPVHRILVVFPDNVDASSSVRWQDPNTGIWKFIED